MSKQRHTPGPWHICSNADNRPTIETQARGGANDDYEIVKDMRGPDGSANARLIAAAPELLEACETAHGWMLINDKESLPVFYRLRAAIAKATEG